MRTVIHFNFFHTVVRHPIQSDPISVSNTSQRADSEPLYPAYSVRSDPVHLGAFYLNHRVRKSGDFPRNARAFGVIYLSCVVFPCIWEGCENGAGRKEKGVETDWAREIRGKQRGRPFCQRSKKKKKKKMELQHNLEEGEKMEKRARRALKTGWIFGMVCCFCCWGCCCWFGEKGKDEPSIMKLLHLLHPHPHHSVLSLLTRALNCSYLGLNPHTPGFNPGL